MRKRKQAIVIRSVEEYKCTQWQICIFQGAHVNPPTKIVQAKGDHQTLDLTQKTTGFLTDGCNICIGVY